MSSAASSSAISGSGRARSSAKRSVTPRFDGSARSVGSRPCPARPPIRPSSRCARPSPTACAPSASDSPPTAQSLLDTFTAAPRPLTIPEILDDRPELAQSSVYRNLVVLEEAGVVHRVVGADEFARWELAEDLTGHHHHLICASCGRVEDVPASAGLERSVAAAAAAITRTHRASAPSTTASTSSACARPATDRRSARASCSRPTTTSGSGVAGLQRVDVRLRSLGADLAGAASGDRAVGVRRTRSTGYALSPYAWPRCRRRCRPSPGTASPRPPATPTAGSSALSEFVPVATAVDVDAVEHAVLRQLDEPRHLGLAVRAPVRDEDAPPAACRSARS